MSIKTFKNSKTKTFALIFIALMMTSAIMFATPNLQIKTAQAQVVSGTLGGEPDGRPGGSQPLPTGVTPDTTQTTTALLSFTPNPIGVNQELLVNIWMTPNTHVSRYFTDYQVVITKPDGTKDTVTLNSYYGDTTAWFQYKVTMVGTWTLQFNFLGGYFPAGNYTLPPAAWTGAGVGNATFPQSVYYLPDSSPSMNLTVQNEMVSSWPTASLPTDYWTRPISLENRDWWVIAGNYPDTGYVGGGDLWDQLYPGNNPHWSSNYAFTPWVTAPNSCHIVWDRQEAIAGLIGSEAGIYGVESTPSAPSLIYSGRCYMTYTQPGMGTASTSVAECFDLQTGQMYYQIPIASGGVTPTIIQYESPSAQPALATGAAEADSVQVSWLPQLITISNGYLQKINPWTGAVTLNASIAPLTGSGGTYYQNLFVLGIQTIGSGAAIQYRLINWTTAGESTNFQSRIISNVSYPISALPSTIDWNAGIGCNVLHWPPTPGYPVQAGSPNTGVPIYSDVVAYNIATGVLLWNKTITLDNYNSAANCADHGKIAIMGEDGYYLALNLADGSQAWQSEVMPYPWASSSFGSYSVMSGYGLLLWPTYAGVVAFNWTSGKIAWVAQSPARAAAESPYQENETSLYPFMDMGGGKIADGKLYIYNNEHSVSTPYPRGWGLNCYNMTNGQFIWDITDTVGYSAPVAISDGYLTSANQRDGYLYVFGKGLSATTITTPDTVVAQGTGITIKGTVLDMSPGQPNTPCVSADSMRTQMEQLHMQYPIDGIWHNETIKGVPVTITAVGSDGTTINVGTTTTDGYGGTFGISWTPPKEDTYVIKATFAGDDSYGSSMATSTVGVGPAPSVSPAATQQPQLVIPDYTATIIAGVIAVIISVAIIGALVLKKK